MMRIQVKEASCYGNLANCEAPGQKCCRTTYERVCQQVAANMMMMVAAMTMIMTTKIILIIEPAMRGGNTGKVLHLSDQWNQMSVKELMFNWNQFKVPTRVPVMVNMTIAGRPTRKQDCQMVERTIPRYKAANCKIWKLRELEMR